MSDPIVLRPGDPCPACGGAITPARVPTDDQRKRAANIDNAIVLPRDMDTATPEQLADLGALSRCRDCGYQTRFKNGQARPSKAA